MTKFTPISGFPEWLPEQRLLEQACLDAIRTQYELYGFTNIETRSVEPISVLTGNGDDKEIYVLGRLQENRRDEMLAYLARASRENRPVFGRPSFMSEYGITEEEIANYHIDEFGLHFDLTVPTARYVQQFKGQLTFPFKRYQMQKVWRGERPQEGRYREFTQCDIDVIGDGELPSHYDAEVVRLLAVVTDALAQQFNFPPITLRVNNRKILQGFFGGVCVANPVEIIRIIDKIDKIGPAKVKQQLQSELGLKEAEISRCLAIAEIKTSDTGFIQQVRNLGVSSSMLDEGLKELEEVLLNAADLNSARVTAGLPPAVKADLSIARGLAYYTGMVCEGQMQGFESSGSVCGGGRYDNLASDAKVKLPGVGVSIGLTRILGLLFSKGVLKPTRKTPTQVLVALNDDASRATTMGLANQLRARGIKTDTYHAPKPFGKQIEAASKRGIPYVWFIGADGSHQVKNLSTGEQTPADPSTWLPTV